jgi:hypothetical protein
VFNLKKLIPILEEYTEHSPLSLLHILYKNHDGKTALDIAIDQEAPKSIEVLLNNLRSLSDYSLSRHLYHHFEVLFEMGLKCFEDYLETCFFKTIEMKETNKLRIRDPNVE